jgi:hypothetical protein
MSQRSQVSSMPGTIHDGSGVESLQRCAGDAAVSPWQSWRTQAPIACLRLCPIALVRDRRGRIPTSRRGSRTVRGWLRRTTRLARRMGRPVEPFLGEYRARGSGANDAAGATVEDFAGNAANLAVGRVPTSSSPLIVTITYSIIEIEENRKLVNVIGKGKPWPPGRTLQPGSRYKGYIGIDDELGLGRNHAEGCGQRVCQAGSEIWLVTCPRCVQCLVKV